jgi:ribosomal-protein-alanine N-acetyltransferase
VYSPSNNVTPRDRNNGTNTHKETPEENGIFISNPLCQDTVDMTIDFYKKVGFVPPWIGYYVKQNNDLVGCATFKGQPIKGTIEIAYGIFEQYRTQGIGTAICKLLVDLSLKTDPSVKITARTLSEKNFPAKILIKNKFICIGTVNDPEYGEVWEWVFKIDE